MTLTLPVPDDAPWLDCMDGFSNEVAFSPEAEAIINAITLGRYDVPYQACASIDDFRRDAAAVLRAAIIQMNDCDGLLHGMELLQCIADELAPPTH